MKYFTYTELTASETAKRKGINNNANESIRANLKALVENLLDPLRVKYGKPIIVTSGYRCRTLNTAVGGASNSGHLYGYAADIVAVGKTPVKNAELLKVLLAMIKAGQGFDKVISEYPDKLGRPSWIHVSWRTGRNRKQMYTGKRNSKGKVYYTEGIELKV